MARDGVLTQAETLGDLTICQSSPRELQYLDFPFAEAGPPPTLGHEASASFEIVVAPSETREKLVGARGAERSERFDGRKSRRKRRRGIVDMPHRDLEQDVWTASRRGELDDRLTAHAKRCHAERRVCRDLGRHGHRSPPPCGLEEKRKPARDPGVRVFANEMYTDWLLLDRPELKGRLAFDIRFELTSKNEIKKLVDIRRRVEGWRQAVSSYGLFVLNKGPEGPLAAALLRERGAKLMYRGHDAIVVWRPVKGSR